MNTYEQGVLAFAEGNTKNPYPTTSSEARQWHAGYQNESERAAEIQKSAECAERIRNMVDAIESFVDAKIRLFHHGLGASTDCAETREHLSDKLAELIGER